MPSIPWRLAALTLASCLPLAAPAAAQELYAADRDGNLFALNLATGAGTDRGILSFETTEIEFDATGRGYAQLPDGSFLIHEFDPETGETISGLIVDGHSFTGLEFIGGDLYGTSIDGPGGPSELRILDPFTGDSTLIGATGVGPISGLAWNGTTLFGIAGGGGPAQLFSISRTTGDATALGSTGIQAGSLEFGPDGRLYAGGTGPDAGNLFRIVPGQLAVLVGPIGTMQGVTGLALRPGPAPVPALPIPALGGLGLFLAAGGALLVRRARATA